MIKIKTNKGQKIVKLRKKLGLSQTDLAILMGVKNQTLFKYENNIVTNIPSDKIELLCHALYTTPSYIMGWEDEPTTENSSATLPTDEQELLNNYRQLNEEGQQKASVYIEELVELGKYEIKRGLLNA